jgi:cell division protein FtsQ
MVGGRSERGARRRTHAASVVVPFPRDTGARQALARIVPSGRSLLVGLALVLGAVGAYWVALTSSLFAVEAVAVRGTAPENVAREVERATADLVGTSLLSVDAAAVERSVRALPAVAGVSVDRAFPHTLVIKIAAERPVGVARQGSSAWLVAASGKVIRELERGTARDLPRIWLPADAPVAVGRLLPAEVVPATRAIGSAREAGLRRAIKSARILDGQLTLVLASGPELRFGDPSDVLLKLTVAARVLPLVDSGAAYLDVSVPERPVSSSYLNS